MPPRTQRTHDRSPTSPILVRVVREDTGHAGTNWWECQPQQGSVDNPEDDDNQPTFPAWWPASGTQPKLEGDDDPDNPVMAATQIASNNQWILSALDCEDLEDA